MIKLTDELKNSLNSQGIQHIREIPSQGICGLEAYIFTIGLLCHMDYYGKQYRYCYKNFVDAYHAINHWDGEGHPPGPWIKRKGSGADISHIDVSHDEAIKFDEELNIKQV